MGLRGKATVEFGYGDPALLLWANNAGGSPSSAPDSWGDGASSGAMGCALGDCGK